MATTGDTRHDVMQVCRNGHVITDLLRSYPERGVSHCHRCGATTLDRCPTCGQELPGASLVPGLVAVGHHRAPDYCATCGAPFPWAERPADIRPSLPGTTLVPGFGLAGVPRPTGSRSAGPAGPADAGTADTAGVSGTWLVLEPFLRRLPRAIRQLRSRHDARPPFRVDDVHDLEDLLRALLPLYFDDIRPENRTPVYASGTRTDFLVGSGNAGSLTAIVIKRVAPALREAELANEWQHDVAYYEPRGKCALLVGFVYDPEGRLLEPRQLENAWSKIQDRLDMQCVIAS